jgi:predicted PurR-regulated permease PerM
MSDGTADEVPGGEDQGGEGQGGEGQGGEGQGGESQGGESAAEAWRRARRQAGVLSVFASVALAALTIYMMVVGQSILLPFVIAVFIVILLDSMAARFCRPVVGGMRLPGWAGMSLSILVMIGALVLLGDIVATNVNSVTDRAPTYQQNIQNLLRTWTERLGIDALPSVRSLAQEIDVAAILRTAASQITAVAGNIFTILFYVVFILLEQATFRSKIEALFRDAGDAKTVQATIRRIAHDIQRYIGLKTLVSAMTGILSYVVMVAVGVDFAGFWAVLIFVLNYIPYVGSLVGVAFPSVLALIQFDNPINFLVVAGVLAGVQVTVGNVVEPRLMGRSLNLSPLVILLALAVFGSIWGIVGMVLSIPFTVIAMLICAQFEPTRAVAILLSAEGRISEEHENG